jgi:hypothetical protein
MGIAPAGPLVGEMISVFSGNWFDQVDATLDVEIHTATSALTSVRSIQHLPAAFAPFVDVGFLLAVGRVVAVAWVEPGVVGEDVEQAGMDVVEDRREVLRRPGLAFAAREQGITSAVKTSGSTAGRQGSMSCRHQRRQDLTRDAEPMSGTAVCPR